MASGQGSPETRKEVIAPEARAYGRPCAFQFARLLRCVPAPKMDFLAQTARFASLCLIFLTWLAIGPCEPRTFGQLAEQANGFGRLQSSSSTVDPQATFDGQLRFVWGGSAARPMRGTISISFGSLKTVQNLSQSIHSIGSVRNVAPNILKIDQSAATTFGGFDLRLECPLDAELMIRLENAGAEPFEARYLARDLLSERKLKSIDDQGTRVAIERMVFDSFRIESQPNLDVAKCESTASVQVSGYRTPLKAGEYQLELLLKGDESTERISRHAVSVDASGDFPPVEFRLTVPPVEGVYNLVAIMRPQRTLPSFYSDPGWIRNLEFVALDPNRNTPKIEGWKTIATRRLADPGQDGFLQWLSPVAERTSKAFQSLAPLPALSRNEPPIGSGDIRNVLIPVDSRRLSTDNQAPTTVGINDTNIACLRLEPNSWRAIPLGQLDASRPHRLRIRVPAMLPGDLSFSIRGDLQTWQDAAAAPSGLSDPIGNDYRIERHRSASTLGSMGQVHSISSAEPQDMQGAMPQSGTQEFSVLFWPPESESYLCLANTNRNQPTYAYDFSIEEAKLSEPANGDFQSLVRPAAAVENIATNTNSTETLRCGVFIDKPLLHSILGTHRNTDPEGQNKLESWSTTYTACERLVTSLSQANANLLVIKVQAEGGALFPSSILDPTTKFDSGAFFSDGRTPGIKDAVKLLMQCCARQDIRVVLCLDFEGPLPAKYFNESTADETGPTQVRQDGQKSNRVNPLYTGFGRYLHDSINDVLARYGEFESFAGVQIQLDRKSQLIFKGDRWGFHPQVVAQFRGSQGVTNPKSSTNITGPELQSFLSWRSQRIASQLETIAQSIQAARPDAELYVDLSRLWEPELSFDDFREPALLSRNPAQLLLAIGIDLDAWQSIPGMSVQRASTISSKRSIDSRQWVRSIARDVAIGPRVNNSNPKQPFPTEPVLIYEQPDSVRVPLSSVASSETPAKQIFPFDLSVNASPRAAILRHLACSNPKMIAAGSWLPNGSDLLELSSLFAILRERPLLPFQPAISKPMQTIDQRVSGSGELQDVMLSIARDNQHSYLQIINLCPWNQNLTLLSSPLTEIPMVRELGSADAFDASPTQTNDHWEWNLQLRGHEVKILKIDTPQFQVLDAVFGPSDQVVDAVGNQLRKLSEILEACQDPTLQQEYVPLDGGFEEWENPAAPRPKGWSISSLPNVKFQPSREFPHSGRTSVKIESNQPGEVPAWLHSKPFAPPETGRLQVEVWMRCPTIESNTQVRLSVIGRKPNGERFESSKLFGGKSSASTQRIANDWGPRPALLDVGDIPIEEVGEVFIAIEMLGTGSVWIDDVKVRKSWLQPSELRYVSARLLLAEKEIESNHLLAAHRLLESDWGRYLNRSHPFYELPPLEIENASDEASQQTAGSTGWQKPGKDAQQSWSEQSAWGRTSKLFDQMRRSMLESWQR